MDTQEKVINFLRDRGDISIRSMTDSLGLRNGSVNLKTGTIPDKHVMGIVEYLTVRFGYSDSTAAVIASSDNPVENSSVVIKVYNKKGVPKFKTNHFRYKDKGNGLWKRVIDWHKVRDKETGKMDIKEDWKPKDDVVESDKVGDYYVSNNGNNVYISYKR